MKKLLTLLATLVLCLPMTAKTNMCVQPKNGDIVRYDVEEVEQVFFEKFDDYYLYDTTAIDTSDTHLTFRIISDSTAEVINPYNDYYYEYSQLDSIFIPRKVLINGKEYIVTKIGIDAFNNFRSLKYVRIPNTITDIGDSAFINNISLTSIEIPTSVTKIGDKAFYNSGLTHIALPNSITEIGNHAFAKCKELTSIEIPASVIIINHSQKDYDLSYGQSVTNPFYGCSNLTSINVDSNSPNYSSIDGILYDKKKSLLICAPEKCKRCVSIPSSVDSICDYAFYNCIIKEITIPESVTGIGRGAFWGCGLTYVTIPESVTNIDYEAFSNCGRLSNVTIPKSVAKIEQDAFGGCNKLFGQLVIYDNGTKCYGWIGNKANCTHVTIPEGVTEIGYKAFSDCFKLKYLTIPSTITQIGTMAFSDCLSLTEITIPESVTTIYVRAFSDCTNLDVTIDNSKENIKLSPYAFEGCKSVTYLK